MKLLRLITLSFTTVLFLAIPVNAVRGPFLAPDGGETEPAYSFISRPDWGMFLNGPVGSLSLTLGGERLKLDTSGQLTLLGNQVPRIVLNQPYANGAGMISFTTAGTETWRLGTYPENDTNFEILGLKNTHQNLIVRAYDQVSGSGMTFKIQGGQGQGSNNLQEWLNSSGAVLASISSSGQLTSSSLKLDTTSAKPTCSSSNRGLIWHTNASTGSKDSLEVCAKDATDTYSWHLIY